ncbi:MAG: sel1 repeat family protein [Treponema sp.]|nr:sel1 repeat family protein [Treponema sp.]
MNDSEGNFWKGVGIGWISSKLFSRKGRSNEDISPEGCLFSIIWAPFLFAGAVMGIQDWHLWGFKAGFLKFLQLSVLAPALIALAVYVVFCLMKSKVTATKKNEEEIYSLYNAGQYTLALEKAESLVDKSPFAADVAGLCYFNGEGCSQDLPKAFSYFSKGKDKIEEAGYYYGAMLLFGIGIDKDETTGFEWIKKLALKNNHMPARGDYGYALFKGLGCEKNQTEGIKQMRIACDAGVPYTKYQLGRILYSGEDGTPVDENGGIRLLREAAEADTYDAQEYLTEIGMA